MTKPKHYDATNLNATQMGTDSKVVALETRVHEGTTFQLSPASEKKVLRK
jgi:hypothetical protein